MGTGANLIGQKFGRLTVVSFFEVDTFKQRKWLCVCECGNNTNPISTSDLRKGHSKSCGCLRIDAVTQMSTTHGKSDTPEYHVWCDMKARCYDVKNKYYNYYGGRGIMVCERWKNSFENFLEDMGCRPSRLHTLDRINNAVGIYEKINCRWATKAVQSRNKRNNRYMEYNNESKVLKDWSKVLQISRSTLEYHLRSKNIEEVFKYYDNKRH